MNIMSAIVRNRRIELTAPDEMPDGTEVRVEVIEVNGDKIGMTEAEWRDDPEAIAERSAWLKTIESPELTPEEQAAFARFDEEFRRFNIEAVRKQMEEEPLP